MKNTKAPGPMNFLTATQEMWVLHPDSASSLGKSLPLHLRVMNQCDMRVAVQLYPMLMVKQNDEKLVEFLRNSTRLDLGGEADDV